MSLQSTGNGGAGLLVGEEDVELDYEQQECLDDLPSAGMYERSYMHCDTVNHVAVSDAAAATAFTRPSTHPCTDGHCRPPCSPH